MRNAMRVMLAAMVMASLGVAGGGCGTRAASSSEAIQHAQTLKTPEQQTQYLVDQAQAFVQSQDYREAIKTTQYVLSSVDTNSQAARDLLDQATAQLAADAAAVVNNK